MPRTPVTTKPKAKAPKLPSMKHIRGTVVVAPLKDVAPNYWNANEMDKATQRGLRHDLEHEGWLPSQALTVWRTDEKGRRMNLIIDGENRWRIATADLGWTHGPMCFLDGLTEKDARALTLKLLYKRGKANEKIVAKELRAGIVMPSVDIELVLGIDSDLVARLTKTPALEGPGLAKTKPTEERAPGPAASDSHHRVTLKFTPAQHEKYVTATRLLSTRDLTKSLSQIVVDAVVDAARTPK